MKNVEIIRNKNVVTRLTVNKDRITIKLADKDDKPVIVDFLSAVADAMQKDEGIRVTMRGALEGSRITMMDDLKSFSHSFESFNF